jgi:hypothetical protein
VAAVSPASYIQGAAHSAASERLTFGSLLVPGSITDPLATRGGVRPYGSSVLGSMRVTATGTPDNKSNVAAGSVVIPATTGGAYIGHNDAALAITHNAAHATLDRWDLVVAQVRDAEAGGVDNDFNIVAIAGTPAGSPVVPALPINSYELARIMIRDLASTGGSTIIASGDITDMRTPTATVGGILAIPASALSLVTPYLGQPVWKTDTKELVIWNGTAWDRLSAFNPTPTVQVFTATGTWTKPANAKWVHVRLCGGGGGSGGCEATAAGEASQAHGAGAGGYAESFLDASTLGATVAVVVGVGGTAGAAGLFNGGNGGSSSFGSSLVGANGGLAGGMALAITGDGGSIGSAGGAGVNGQIKIPGERGGTALIRGAKLYADNHGGASFLSRQARSSGPIAAAGSPGLAYGGGAAGGANGASATAKAGAAGSPGICIVETYY